MAGIMYRFKLFILGCCIASMIGCGTINFSPKNEPSIPRQAPITRKKLALVLGGGGAKGFAHLGVLEELDKAGIVPDLIIGCSAGSIVGSLYAANPDIQALKQLLLTSKRSEVIAGSFKDWPYSIYNKDQLAQYLRDNLKVHDFAQTKIPFIATAANLQYGNLTSFSTGNMIDPIVASAALPGAFAPVQIGDQYFIDCSAADPVPVRVAKNLGFETIVAVNIAEQLPHTSPNHLLGVVRRGTEIAYINQVKYAVEGADVVIDFKFKNIGLFSDKFNDYLYKEGRKAGKAAVPKILQLVQK